MGSLGLKLSPQGCTIQELRTVWRIADEAGFDHLWAFDHFNPIFADVSGDVFEGMTLLAAMAEVTSNVRVGLLVTGNTYRHPGVLAKMATTIDHLSGGRLEFAIGASGAEAEHSMLGIGFPSAADRIRALGEALTVCRKLWTEDEVSFAGRYYVLAGATQNPKPVQRPCPRIWVGGAGEQLTLRVVAEHADVWNVIGPVDVVAAQGWRPRRALRGDRPRSGFHQPISPATCRPERPGCGDRSVARLLRSGLHRERRVHPSGGRPRPPRRDRR